MFAGGFVSIGQKAFFFLGNGLYKTGIFIAHKYLSVSYHPVVFNFIPNLLEKG